MANNEMWSGIALGIVGFILFVAIALGVVLIGVWVR